MQNTIPDKYTNALNEIVQEHNQGIPDYFVSKIIFTDDYVEQVSKNQKS